MRVLLLSLILLSAPLYAAEDLAVREARLAMQLRCVVCQNQTVAESNAPLAADMRREIREQLASGRSDDQVVAFFEQRYGSFVHYTPPFKPSTWLLWSAPFLGLIAGLILLRNAVRSRNRLEQPAPLSDAERQRAHRLLDEETKP